MSAIKHSALSLLELIERREKEYFELNRRIRALQGDFPAHVTAMDTKICTAIIDLLDLILGKEWASWYLYDRPKKDTTISHPDGKKYKIDTVNDLRDYLFREEE